MQAEIVAVGAELLAGRRVDTNSHAIQKALRAIGIATRFGSTVTDRLADVALVLRAALARADVVIVTGGLGPTADDVTRKAIALALDVPLEESAEAWRQIQDHFVRLGRSMPPSNRLQAMMPRGTSVLENTRGTAPGVCVRQGEKWLFAMPGVPSEMTAMLADQVVPRLRSLVPSGALYERAVHLIGMPEASAGEKIRHLMEAPAPPEVAITVHDGVISIVASGPSETRARIEAIIAELHGLFGEKIFSEDNPRLEEVVGAKLLAARCTIAVAESCTGGLLCAQLTRVPGISEVLLEGAVPYANAAKIRALGVPAELIAAHGAVSAAVASAMALGIARSSGARLGVSTTGIAGPGGGSVEKPVGLVYVALARDGRAEVQELRLSGGREAIMLRAVQSALNMIRLALK